MKAGPILLYHRVLDLEHDPEQLAVSPSNFEAHVQYLQNTFSVVPLADIVRKISLEESLEDTATITFDDGYADNLSFARPILENHRAPATFFLTAGMIGSKREFWWDEIERIVFSPDNEGRQISLEIDGSRHLFDFQTESVMDSYRNIHKLIRHLPHEKRYPIIKKLLKWSLPEGKKTRPANRVLNKQDVKELARSTFVEIGSHGMTHTPLSAESAKQLRHEVVKSRKILERITGSSITSFSYPFGLSHDVNAEVISEVRSSGYSCGIANTRGLINSGTDLFMIPRMLVRNWNLTEFQQKISEFIRVHSGASRD